MPDLQRPSVGAGILAAGESPWMNSTGPAASMPDNETGRQAARFVWVATRAQGAVPRTVYFSLASARSASARSVFSHENAVAVCFLPAPST